MFNSTILDVAIGMIFVYLLLSLLCSAANELIELVLKKRARELENGISELLTDQQTKNVLGRFATLIKGFTPRLESWLNGVSSSPPKGIVADIYNHSLVSGLFKGTYEVGSRRLPAYIPATNFALALMDWATQQTAAAPATGAAVTPPPPTGALNAMAPPTSTSTIGEAYQVVVNLAAGAPLPVPPAPSSPANPLKNLRDAVGTLPANYEKVKNALLPLIDAAGNDAAKARQNIENWYNSAMDRVSGWYKRRAQVILFALGLIMAIALNVDSIVVAKRLSTDRQLRDALVAAADEYAKANATASPSPSPKPPTKDAESSSSDPCSEKECKDGKDSPQCKLKRNECQLKALGLPIGWLEVSDNPQLKWPGANFRGEGGWWDQIGWHWLGWLLTALAISLGAPFWFDMLNKFIVVRSTVKPKEKSPEEKSKD